jgi:26S proteasome regulatory subunit N3
MVVVMRLIDVGEVAKAAECSRDMITRIRTAPKRASCCDEIVAKCFFYFARSFELLGKANEVRSDLHAALRTASLRSDEPSQAVLLNLLIRNYISADLIDQAARLVDKTVFPESVGEIDPAPLLFVLTLAYLSVVLQWVLHLSHP